LFLILLFNSVCSPSTLDEFFPQFRMKDWYLGNSWASGLAMGYPNGRNQESSSESIAAYEAVSMFGNVMVRMRNEKTIKIGFTLSQNSIFL
jgi:endo-1,3(4)-beta-glucanase